MNSWPNIIIKSGEYYFIVIKKSNNILEPDFDYLYPILFKTLEEAESFYAASMFLNNRNWLGVEKVKDLLL